MCVCIYIYIYQMYYSFPPQTALGKLEAPESGCRVPDSNQVSFIFVAIITSICIIIIIIIIIIVIIIISISISVELSVQLASLRSLAY